LVIVLLLVTVAGVVEAIRSSTGHHCSWSRCGNDRRRPGARAVEPRHHRPGGERAMKIARTAAAVLLLASTAATARAGRTNYFETSVDMAAGTALGSIVDTRRTADFVQYIGCSVAARAGDAPRVTCLARSTTAGPLSCSSSRPELVAVAQALTDEGYIRFECEGAELDYLYVAKGSLWLP
jgi:hypothetical protein